MRGPLLKPPFKKSHLLLLVHLDQVLGKVVKISGFYDIPPEMDKAILKDFIQYLSQFVIRLEGISNQDLTTVVGGDNLCNGVI